MTSEGEDRETWTGAALRIGLGGTLLAMLLGMLTPPGAVWHVPRELERRVSDQLEAAGFGALEVGMDGQRAVLSGVVASAAERDRAQRQALRAAGLGGRWAGGVTSVDVSGVRVDERMRRNAPAGAP